MNWVGRHCAITLTAGAVIFVMTRSSDARADLAQDATAIIEQVIEDDIAKDVVPAVACQMPLAVDYFTSTIGAIENERFSGLPLILRKEASDLLGLSILHALDPNLTTASSTPVPPPVAAGARAGAPAAAAVAPPPATTTKTRAAPSVVYRRQAIMLANLTRKKGTPASSPLAVDAATPAVQPAVTLVAAAAGAAAAVPPCPFLPWPGTPTTSKATKQMTSCLLPQGDITEEFACATALTIRDAADGEDSLLPNDLQRLAASLVVEALSQSDAPWAAGKTNWVQAATKLRRGHRPAPDGSSHGQRFLQRSEHTVRAPSRVRQRRTEGSGAIEDTRNPDHTGSGVCPRKPDDRGRMLHRRGAASVRPNVVWLARQDLPSRCDGRCGRDHRRHPCEELRGRSRQGHRLRRAAGMRKSPVRSGVLEAGAKGLHVSRGACRVLRGFARQRSSGRGRGCEFPPSGHRANRGGRRAGRAAFPREGRGFPLGARVRAARGVAPGTHRARCERDSGLPID